MNISEFKPEKFFYYFEQISAIPHGSFNTDAIADYCMDFAKERGLAAQRDEAGNVLICKDATPGYEICEPVMIQGHLDMVCEKTLDCTLDMSREPITLLTDGEWIWADKTTLGADDGVAIALMLGILDSDDIAHPPLECLMTTNEEVGMIGADKLGITGMKSTSMINIDSSFEGIVTAGCAGGLRTEFHFPLEKEASGSVTAFRYQLSGLLGGHSGEEIDQHRQNALVLIGRFLCELSARTDFYISDILCEGKDNVIPPHASVNICCTSECAAEFKSAAAEVMDDLRNAFIGWEPGIAQELDEISAPAEVLSRESAKKLIFILQNMPLDVLTWHPYVKGAPLSSANIGRAFMTGNDLCLTGMVRSNVTSELDVIANRLKAFAELLGGTFAGRARYPAWDYNKDSRICNLMADSYAELYGKRPEITITHVGLECGILTGHLGNIDMVSIGPDHPDIHTPNEKLSVSSVKRTWDLLIRLFEKMK